MAEPGFLLREADLLPLSIGAALLGTGGGGNPHLGRLRAREALRAGAVVRIVPLDTLPDDAWIGAVGVIGSPMVGVEKLAEGTECLRAMRAVEDAAGVKLAGLIAVEIGGANAMAPLVTAGQAGLPVVDGDGMGRAFPEVQMTTFSIYGGPSSPTALADAQGNVAVLRRTVDGLARERLARSLAVAMGATAGAAGAPMPMDYVRRTAVPGTVTQALDVGRAVVDARARRHDVIERIVAAIGARPFFTGTILDVRRDLEGGFTRGHVSLRGIHEWSGSEARIAIQNENLVLWVDGEPRITVPDLIINLELETGEPITTEALRYGQRVVVIGMPVHPLLKTPEALKVVGPRAFGYPDLEYRPMATGASP